MTTFSFGEEVIFDEERYVLAAKSEGEPLRYRLLATRPDGAKMVWADPRDITKIKSYTEPNDDTDSY